MPVKIIDGKLPEKFITLFLIKMVAGSGSGLNEKRFIEDYAKIVSEIQGGWVPADTAILVIHGIGNQNPLETLDGFARGLVQAYPEAESELVLEHQLARKTASDRDTPWFDNVLRIKKKGAAHHIDVYEYYWAHETEGQATFKDLQTWLHKVTSGAKKFYRDNAFFAVENKDDSPFISGGTFSGFRYKLLVSLVPQLLLLVQWIFSGIYTLLSGVPLVGSVLSRLAESTLSRFMNKITNVLNDITIYNTTDAKSNFFKIRNCILNGAVGALRYLLEPQAGPNGKLHHLYPRVMLAGHSLGSQVAFDAINRLNHLVNQGEIKGYGKDGSCESGSDADLSVCQRLVGLVTFGSPLDKIAFFFREQVPETEYLRRQIIASFHGFKQREWLAAPESKNQLKVSVFQQRLFEDLRWYNYWDARDYVSGSLDYYAKVTNINCCFQSGRLSFTHSNYWECQGMFAEVYKYFLFNGGKDNLASELTKPDDNAVGGIHVV